MPPLTRFAAPRFSLIATGLLWTLPFLQPHHRYPLTSFYSEWLAIVLGLVALVLLLNRQHGRETQCPVTVLFILGFVALLALQFAAGRIPYAGMALVAALYLGWAALLMILGGALRRDLGLTTVVTTLAWFLLAAGCLNAIIALLQYFDIATLFDPLIARTGGAAVYGNLAQRNHFASYSMLAFASIAYLFARGRIPGALAVAAAAPLAFTLGLSGSRSVLLYLAVVLALAVPFFRGTDPGGRRLLACVAVFLAGAVASQWIATLPGLAPTGGAVTTAQRYFSDVESVNQRIHLAAESWWMLLRAPLLGVGWGQFALHEFEYRSLFGLTALGWPHHNAHNIVLHLLAVAGLLGASLIVGAAAFWLWGLRRAAFDLERWWLLVLIAVIGVHSLLEYPLWYAYFLGIAAVVLGLGSERNLTLRPGRAGAITVLLLLGTGVYFAASALHGYREFERLFARDAAVPEGNERAIILSRAHREPMLRPYAELAISFDLRVDAERLRDKLALNGRVMRFAPIDVVVYRQAMLLALAGEPQAAARQLERAARVYPGELATTVSTLRELAARYPREMEPLLELAAAISAERRAGRVDH
ncbi:MAG: O-antigen ligase C-terminal domain-containing protein [Betaproteobacteria bacterium]|nr:O-antigen ligase C-terminal domain-containing protein [Betaproteobacteria bacterium]